MIEEFLENSRLASLSFPRRVAILGSSGSVGRSALEVIAASEGRLQVAMMSIHRRADILVEQILQMRMRLVADQLRSLENDAAHAQAMAQLPQCVIMTDEWADRTPLKDLPPEIEVRFGQEALCEYVQRKEIDIVLSAIVGSAGFRST